MGMAINGDRLYVTNFYGNSVTVIDTTTNTVVGAPIPVGSQPNGIGFSPDGSLGYVANYDGGTLTVFDTATNTVIDSIRVGSAPSTALASPDGNILVSNSGGNTVSVISLVAGNNAAPVAADPAYTVTGTNPTTGAVAGTVNVTDPNTDAVSYAVTTAPAKGSATVTTGGTFTYTPTPTARHQASAEGAGADLTQDSFTVTAADVHGASVAVPVTVAVSPSNTVPAAHPAFGDPGPNGVVGGSLVPSDADGDTLTYSVTSGPASGTVTVYSDGTFSYDPTDAARLRAGFTQTTETDSFVITITVLFVSLCIEFQS